MTRLFATDLDGTLLETGGTVSEANLAALRRAEAAGVEIVFVTGRPPRWMRDLPAMTGHQGFALCANGALLLDLADHSIVEARTLDADAAIEVAQRLRELDPGMSFAVEVAHPSDDFIVDLAYRPRWEPLVSPPRMSVPDMLGRDGVVKFLARPSSGATHDADSFLLAATEVAHGLLEFTHSDVNDLLIEMSALGVNKGTGLALLAQSRGWSASDVAAVGDMPNDVPMVQWAGRGAAVDNAHDWVKAVADEHVPSNDEHGVAVFIERLLNS